MSRRESRQGGADGGIPPAGPDSAGVLPVAAVSFARTLSETRPIPNQDGKLPSLNHILISCEHGGREIPEPYRRMVAIDREILDSHRGYDAGALDLALALAQALGAPLLAGRITRLLIDLNRSPGSPALYSPFSRRLSVPLRDALLWDIHQPHRQGAKCLVEDLTGEGGRLLHLAIHSFTPIWKGRRRATDIGLLYDPARIHEAAWADRLIADLKRALPDLAIHRNRPYRGTADGLNATLRSRFAPERYLGMEIEINQRHILDPTAAEPRFEPRLHESLIETFHKKLPTGATPRSRAEAAPL